MKRTIVITGSASGLGKATAELLEKDGDKIIRVDLKEGDVKADLSTMEGREEAIQRITELSPEGVDGVITWAGLGGPRIITAIVNYFGTVDFVEDFALYY